MRLTMATTGKSNVNFIIYINSSDTIWKICYKVLLNMENQNLKVLFNNKRYFLLYTEFIQNWFK